MQSVIMKTMTAFSVVLSVLLLPQQCDAYFGLGPVAPLIGNAIALLFIFGVSLLGVIVYPLKVWLSARNKKKSPSNRE